MTSKKFVTGTIKTYASKGVDLGTLQDVAEKTAKALQSANAVLAKSKKEVEDRQSAYDVAQKALIAGVEQLRAATKV